MKKLLFLLAAMLIAAGISVAQTDQNNPNSNPGNSPAATQSSPSAQGTTPDQGTAAQGATDQTSTTTTHHRKSSKSGNLPQTASPLPLLGLLGMGSLAAGVASRKKKRS